MLWVNTWPFASASILYIFTLGRFISIAGSTSSSKTASSQTLSPFLKHVHHGWLHDARRAFFCMALVYWGGLFLSPLPSSAQTKQTRAFAQDSSHQVSTSSFIPVTFRQRNHQSSTIQSIPWSQDIMQSSIPNKSHRKTKKSNSPNVFSTVHSNFVEELNPARFNLMETCVLICDSTQLLNTRLLFES